MRRISSTILLSAVMAATGCGTDDPSFRLGYSVQVVEASVTDFGGDEDAFGASAEVDIYQSICPNGDPEEFGSSEAELTLRVTRRGGSFDDDGQVVDDVSGNATGLEIRVTRVTVEYIQVPSGGNDVSVSVPALDMNFDDSGLTLDATTGDIEGNFVLPLFTIGTKTTLAETFGSAIEDWLADPDNLTLPVAQMQLRYTVYYTDNFGETGFVTHTGQVHLAPWNRC